jgi:hypothetical protein
MNMTSSAGAEATSWEQFATVVGRVLAAQPA